MKSFIIDPANKSIEEIELPNQESNRIKKIVDLLGSDQYHITFLYPEEYRTCTGYLTTPKKDMPFFQVKGFVDKVKFGKTVVIDKTATGFPKSDNITLAELQSLITFFP